MQHAIVNLGYRPSIVASDADLRGSQIMSKMPESIQTALREAGESGQLVFLDFHAPWCGACKKLEETTFSDASVQKALGRFHLLKVDTDENPALGKYFRVIGLPTILVVNASAQELYRHVGPIGAEGLVHELVGL
jgi:thiol:disulfide interchange protein DsbD